MTNQMSITVDTLQETCTTKWCTEDNTPWKEVRPGIWECVERFVNHSQAYDWAMGQMSELKARTKKQMFTITVTVHKKRLPPSVKVITTQREECELKLIGATELMTMYEGRLPFVTAEEAIAWGKAKGNELKAIPSVDQMDSMPIPEKPTRWKITTAIGYFVAEHYTRDGDMIVIAREDYIFSKTLGDLGDREKKRVVINWANVVSIQED